MDPFKNRLFINCLSNANAVSTFRRLIMVCFCGILFLPCQVVGQETAGESAPEIGIIPASTNVSKYVLDNSHTSIVFAVSHFGLSYAYGRFNEVSGHFSLDGEKLTDDGFQFIVKTNSIDTNNGERDKHLRGPDFFNSDEYPEIKFATKSMVRNDDGSMTVTGDFTMLGKTKPVTMPIKVLGVGKGPFGKQRAGYFAKFAIKRSDFGMGKMLGQIGDNISITFSFEGVKE